MARDEVIEALSRQVNCYRRLAKLAELQHVHVQQSQTEALLDVLAKRQQVLTEIAAIEQQVAPSKRRWSAYVATLDGADRAEAESLLAESRRLLEQITTADRNDAMVLQQRKLNVSREMNQAQAARAVNRNYATAAYGRTAATLNVQR